MKRIPLTQGKYALVDDEDYEALMEFKWHFSHGYAARREHYKVSKGVYKGKKIYMHRAICSPPEGMTVDHINGDGLINTRGNLRVCTQSENCMNQTPQTDTISKYKGVSFLKRTGKWCAYIVSNKKQIHLGYFSSEKEAAEVYNKAALNYFGEFSKLNEVVA